jgi:4a-hydroxytetrahydrobiopterin dehydratase
MSLTQKHCIPCESGVQALSQEEIGAMIRQVPEWQLLPGDWISRQFTFKNFVESLSFVNQVGEVAEAEGHHPDITFGWGYVDIKLQTHAINGLHENDFIVAAKINELLEK